MRQLGRRGTAVASMPILLLMLVVASSASAHVTEASGPFRVEMGWGNEPPLVSSDNFVEVEVADAAGTPVAVPAGALSVEVSYAGTAVTLPLIPGEIPGELSAELIPTRPGTYAFHITGTVQGQTLDVEATCSEATFECVEEGSSAEFPVKDPSPGELSQRLSRESDRVREATDTAESAKTLALVALVPALLALGMALALTVRGRRRNGQP